MKVKEVAAAVLAMSTWSALADHSVEHAELLTLGVQARSTVDAGQIVYWRFDLDGAATVEVRSGGNEADPVGTLLDARGGEIDTDDDSATGLNFRMVADLQSGPHYIRIEAPSLGGSYGVVARLLRDDDYGDTAAASSRLPANERIAGRLDPAGDLDVFRLDLRQPSRVVVTSDGPTDTDGRLVSANGATIAYETGGGSGRNFRITQSLAAGVYYLRVGGPTVGPYGILLDDGVGTGAPPVAVDSLLGTWAGVWRWRHLGGVSDRMWEFDTVYRHRGRTVAVDSDFDPAWFNGTDESFFVGYLVPDFLAADDAAREVDADGYDDVVLYRGSSILCFAWTFSLSSSTRASDGAVMEFGDIDVDKAECVWEGANEYVAAVVQVWPGSPDSSGGSRGATGSDDLRRLDARMDERMRNSPGRPVSAHVRAVLQSLE